MVVCAEEVLLRAYVRQEGEEVRFKRRGEKMLSCVL